MGLLLRPANDHQGLPEIALGVARGMGQRHEHPPCLTAILPRVVLDDGVFTVEAVFVPEPLEDALGGVSLLLREPEMILQDPVYDAGEGLFLSLSKGWDVGAGSVGGSPAAPSRPTFCAPCPGAARMSALLPGCSCLRP